MVSLEWEVTLLAALDVVLIADSVVEFARRAKSSRVQFGWVADVRTTKRADYFGCFSPAGEAD